MGLQRQKKLGLFWYMTQRKNKLATRLTELSRELAQIAAEISAETPVAEATFPEKAAKKMQTHCLDCSRPITECGRLKRGLCTACYQRMLRRLERKEVTEAELISRGLLANPSQSGRRTTLTRLSDLATKRAARELPLILNEAIEQTRKRRKREAE